MVGISDWMDRISACHPSNTPADTVTCHTFHTICSLSLSHVTRNHRQLQETSNHFMPLQLPCHAPSCPAMPLHLPLSTSWDAPLYAPSCLPIMPLQAKLVATCFLVISPSHTKLFVVCHIHMSTDKLCVIICAVTRVLHTKKIVGWKLDFAHNRGLQHDTLK